MAALQKQLEEAQRLKDQAEKSRKEAVKAKVEAEQATNVAEQKGYDLGVAEIEETLRAEVLGVCHIYCAQTWDEALNRAVVEASSKLRKAENVFYPPAIWISDPPSTQAKMTSINIDPNPEESLQDPPPPSQQEPAKEASASQVAPLDKAAAVPNADVASQGFQQDLASTIMPAEGVAKGKEGVATSKADKPANQTSKLQIKLKK